MAENTKTVKKVKRKKTSVVKPATIPVFDIKPDDVAQEITKPLDPVILASKKKISFCPLKSKIPANPQEPKQREIKGKSGRRLWLLAIGLVLIAIGVFLFTIWNTQPQNIVLGMTTVSSILGGAYAVYAGIKQRDSVVVIAGGQKQDTRVANSLNIYARKDETTGQIYPEKIAFEWLDKPTGQPQQCTNNGKWYHVNIWDIEKSEFKPFILPDSQYFDPREFANVIKMPAHKKLFERRVTLLQQIAPWAMVVAFVFAVIGFIATTPPPVAPGG